MSKLNYLILSFGLVSQIACQTFETLSLNNGWTVKNGPRNINIPNMNVPFSVHSALRREKLIPDPLYRYNDLELRWIAKDNAWTISNTFRIDRSDWLSNSQINLEFYSIDTVAKVYLNEQLILESNNEFLKYVVENINSKLKQGENVLRIDYTSAIDYAKNFADKYPYRVPVVCPPDVQRGECHVNKIRKQQCSFSWDWGPAFAPMGLNDLVQLKIINKFDMSFASSIYPNDLKDLTQWIIDVDLEIDQNARGSMNTQALVEISIPALGYSDRANVDLGSLAKVIKNVKFSYKAMNINMKDFLWFPNGFGKQNLFDMKITTTINENKVEKSKRIGFRSVELVEDFINPNNKEHGRTFYFRINNKAVFLKGSNWIPADSFQENITKDYLELLLSYARDYNMNSLRIWGGGLYEKAEFYELADEMGIMIWHDMMFACSMYPTNDAFLSNVENEIGYQVNRLRHHPSIVLWAGNNENEVALAHNWYNTNENKTLYYNDYRKFYVDTIGKTIRKIEPEKSRPYLVSSPSNSKKSEEDNWISENPYDYRYGDVHFYNYEINGWQTKDYPVSRMVSEYGFQSFPSFPNLEPVYAAEDMDYDSKMNDHRQHHGNGNTEIKNEILHNLRLPSSKNKLEHFKGMIYLSQLNQAMSLKTSTEYFIRLRDTIDKDGFGNCMGAMYWQFNDIWQGQSWASIEYGGRLKMAHYFMKKIFSNLLISPYVDTNSNKFNILLVFSEYERTYSNSFTLKVHSYDSFNVIYEKKIDFSIEPHTSKLIYSVDMAEFERMTKCTFNTARSCLVSLEINNKDPLAKEMSDNFLLMNINLAQVNNLKIPKMSIDSVKKITQDQFEIVVKTDQISLFVWLEMDKSEFVGQFSDNGFHMNSPLKTVHYHAQKNSNLQEKDVLEHLKVHSLMNLYDAKSTGSSASANKISLVLLALFQTFIFFKLF